MIFFFYDGFEFIKANLVIVGFEKLEKKMEIPCRMD